MNICSKIQKPKTNNSNTLIQFFWTKCLLERRLSTVDNLEIKKIGMNNNIIWKYGI